MVLFNLSGHGYFDVAEYRIYFNGELQNYDYPEEAINKTMHDLPKVAAPA